jgi:hypothetical protein
VQGHLEAHVLVGVVEAVEQDLGLVLVGAHVVADLGRPQLAALVRLPIENRWRMSGCAAATAPMSATISGYV